MSKQFLTVNGISVNGTEKKKGMIKTYSFTTDEDETKPETDSHLITNRQKSLSKKSLPSESDALPSSTTPKTRKSSHQIESTNMHNAKRRASSAKNTPQPSKLFDRSTILTFIFLSIFLYFAWTKRDLWISRLILSSRGKIRHADLTQTLITSTVDSPSDSSEITETTTMIPMKVNYTDHANIKIRRTKMSFGSEQPKRKLSYVPDGTKHHTKTAKSAVATVPTTSVKTHSPTSPGKTHSPSTSMKTHSPSTSMKTHSPTSSVKTHSPSTSLRTHSPAVSVIKHKSECYRPSNSSMNVLTFAETINRIRTNLTLKNGHQSILPKVMSKTGLSKNQIYRFLYRKHERFLTLDTFLSLLDLFDMKLFIESK